MKPQSPDIQSLPKAEVGPKPQSNPISKTSKTYTTKGGAKVWQREGHREKPPSVAQ